MRSVLYKDEGGFTTAGAVVAVLLALALTFCGVRVFQVNSRSGDVQYIADAGALAAENAVAEFVTMGQVVDAALLSLSLVELTTYAASAVAAFIPGGQGAAGTLLKAAGKVRKVRTSAAKSAVKGLNAAQKALPAVCALRAAACIEANAGNGASGVRGFAMPFPLDGVEYELPDTAAVDEAADLIEDEEGDVAEHSKEADELQAKMDAAKHAAWEADCGKAGMNMQERAGHLAGLSGAANPDYGSPEQWTFSAALQRAKNYYRARYEAEPGASYGASPELVAESVARKRFYKYAHTTVSQGHVGTSASGGEKPHFEKLARNTAQVKATELYTEAVYPVSMIGEALTLHAYEGCPAYLEQEPAGTASVRSIDSGAVQVCDQCQFSVRTLGRVPAASTSIDNGFEYYYRIVAEKADEYREAQERFEEVQGELKGSRNKMVEALRKGLKGLNARYDPQPPGRYGCVCVVYAPQVGAMKLPFVSDGSGIGRRVAVSGAGLAADPASDQGNVLSEIGANLIPSDVLGSGVAKTVFSAWGTALSAYADGNQKVVDVLNSSLGAIPLVGSELSDWAASGFKDAVKSAGLEPADLNTYKPVLVNTSHIASADDGVAAKALLKMKTAAQAYGDVQMGDFEALADTLEIPDSVESLIEDKGLELLKIPLEKYGLGTKDLGLFLDVPQDIRGRLVGLRSP